MVSVVYPYITHTDFEVNTLTDGNFDWGDGGEARQLTPGDSPEHIARKILEAIEGGQAEIFAHAWIGNPRG